MAIPDRPILTRKQAAEYLTKFWFDVSVSTLNRLAWEGDDGPLYERGRDGRGRAGYDRAELDRWAKGWLKPPHRPRNRIQRAAS